MLTAVGPRHKIFIIMVIIIIIVIAITNSINHRSLSGEGSRRNLSFAL